MKNAWAVSRETRKLSELVHSLREQGRFTLVLGGDHSIAIGSLTGVARATRQTHNGRGVSVVWVDAHADINTPSTSLSGYLHGMPLAFASGLAEGVAPFDWIRADHWIDLSRLVYIALRDVDEEERKTVASHGIKVFDMEDIARLGIQKVMELVLQHIGDASAIHLSFDIDSLDPKYAPCTGFPVEGGLSLSDSCYIGRCLHKSGRLVAMDLVEINPLLESDGLQQTLGSAQLIVSHALGFNEE
ncbi:hypothetical protein M409DRAFT_24202 [Zasmidium cellare ATCC 36951]|uniref:Arginase n=1 Tax=Zasmidium cellare ATCC 36951 TaxID=1080233 RepID=A0A6A6CFD3_ZASCE|nr:uncharacterized protein M409DRAFT_24202 [Zasmidium cellare ATCC 36951]KAF2165353.1 hypothetical protein M409DRAFT_24202 [Zasmidium cellare ATCC 36951]